MARTSLSKWLGLALLSFSLTGCVAAEKYNALRMANEAAVQQASQADSEARAARAEAQSYKNQNDQLMRTINENDPNGLINNLQSQLSNAQREIDELRRLNQDMEGRIAPVVVNPLPAQLSNELTEFANRNPEVVDFDSARGVVKFK